MVSQQRSAIIVPVPEAAAIVDGWREQTSSDKPSTGVPAHITLVFPFVPVDRLDDEVVRAVAEIAIATAAFDFVLRRADRLPTTLYLAPEPAEPFIQLVGAIVERFPEFPPYEGVFATIVPHLTVAHGADSLLNDAERDVGRFLPIRATARELMLIAQLEPDSGRWEQHARFTLGG
jgi:2'-5' RNA ligase